MSLLTTVAGLRRALGPRDFGKVAVLQGGDSSEREISLLSGNAVLGALRRRGVDAHPFDPRDRPIQDLAGESFDRAWIALHGPGGEDGLIQGALEWLGVPYTGSGVLASALTMDKLKTNRVVAGAGFVVPESAVLATEADLAGAMTGRIAVLSSIRIVLNDLVAEEAGVLFREGDSIVAARRCID